MRVHSIPLDEGYIFPCSRKAIEQAFGKQWLEWISFGAIGRHFEFESNCHKRPKLAGVVVASLSYSPDNKAHLCLYPVLQAKYGDIGKTSFTETVLPHFNRWLEAKSKRPETFGSSHEQIIAEWTGSEHRFHEVRFLYASN